MTYGTPAYPATSPSGALGLNEIVGILKEMYDGQKVQVMTYQDNPHLAMVKKNPNFGGKLWPLPLVVDANPNASASFASSQANVQPIQIKEFILTRVPGYMIAQISHEAMLAATTDQMSFINGVKVTVDQAIQAAVNFLAQSLFRSGTGSIGQNGGIATGVITLSDPNSVVNFSVNQVLQSAATDGAAPRAALGYVIAVDRSAGTLTVASSGFGGVAATPAAWVSGDFLLVQGNSNATITGLSGWLPQTVSPADSFFSVNRSVDRVRLAGVFWDGSAQSIEEAVIDASTLLAREGGKPEVGITGFSSYSALEKSLGAKVTYTQLSTTVPGQAADAEIAFRGIMVNGANSQIRMFPDRNQAGYTCHLLTMPSNELLSLKEAPHIFNYGDDLQMLRMGSNDAAELRVGFYAQYGINAPGHNAYVKLGA